MQRKPLPSPSKDNKQVKEYTTAVQRGLKSHFVVHTDTGWAVRRPKSTRPSGVFTTKAEAIRHAKAIATKQHTKLYIFNQDGTLTK